MARGDGSKIMNFKYLLICLLISCENQTNYCENECIYVETQPYTSVIEKVPVINYIDVNICDNICNNISKFKIEFDKSMKLKQVDDEIVKEQKEHEEYIRLKKKFEKQ